MSDQGRTIVLVSGGMDSCVTAAMMHKTGDELLFLHVNYGQRTQQREEKAFHNLAEHYGIPDNKRMVCSIAHLAAIGGSSLTDPSIPVSNADLHSEAPPTSYVPFRNAHLLSIAVSWAETCRVQRIAIGAVHEDSSGYPDCRPEYYAAFNELIRVGTAGAGISIVTPVIHMSKEEIILLGAKLNAPLHLTWSCYQNEEIACGVCDSCALRLRGFERAGIPDPLDYAVRPSYNRI